MKNLSLPQKLAIALFLALVFLYSVNQLKESDSFYHLKAGEVIWETKQIPHADIFSYTAAGRPWIAHEWLAELIFFGAYRLGGFWGLIVFVAFLAALAYFLLIRLAVSRGANHYIGPLIAFLLSYLTFELWIPRPQVFAFLALAALIYFLENYRLTGEKKYLWFAVLAIWGWANLNATFVLGLAVIALYAGVEFAKKLCPEFFGEISHSTMKHNFILAFLGATVLSFVNPNTYQVFLYSFYSFPTIQALRVSEWYGILSYLTQNWQTKVFLIEILLVVIFLLWRLGARRESRDPVLLGLVLGATILPFISIRHVGFWPILIIYPAATAISSFCAKFADHLRRPALVAALTFAVALLFLGWRISTFPRTTTNEYLIPAKAADFVEENHLGGPLFNLYNEGGYLIWRFWPKEKIFFDGRSEVYGREQVRELFYIVNAWPVARPLIDEKYKINYFFLAYNPTPLAKAVSPLVSMLQKNGWPLIYWDDTTIIFVRDNKQNRSLIEKYGVFYVSPFRDPTLIPQSEARFAADEFDRLIKRFPGSLIIQNYARRFLESQRNLEARM